MGKYSDCWTYPMEVIDEKFDQVVSKETTVNSKPLSGNVTLTAADVGAVPKAFPVLGEGDDLDKMINASDNGFYGISSSVTNAPANWCHLLVTASSAGVVQTVFKGANLYSRTYSGSPAAWSNWYKYTGTIVS